METGRRGCMQNGLVPAPQPPPASHMPPLLLPVLRTLAGNTSEIPRFEVNLPPSPNSLTEPESVRGANTNQLSANSLNLRKDQVELEELLKTPWANIPLEVSGQLNTT